MPTTQVGQPSSSPSDEKNRSALLLAAAKVKLRRRGDERHRQDAGLQEVAVVKTCHSPTTLWDYIYLIEASAPARASIVFWLEIGFAELSRK